MRKHLYLTMLLLAGAPMLGSFQAQANPEPQVQGQAATTITGTVLDENNEPVIGASVVQKGVSGNAVATDAFGNFTIKVPLGAQLMVSYVGYKTIQLPAAKAMTIYLEPTTEMLNELVAVGYGTQKRANLTGAVASVDVERTMDSRPVADVAKALQGAVPGLTITTANGDIASNPTIKIRGTGTLTNGQSSSPLIVVDGVPVDDMSFLNPEDIAEISVLKDAASAAIYGTRAAFGVVLITTKNPATKDRVSVSYNNNFAWSQASVVPEFASSVDQMKMAMQPWGRGNGDREIFGLYFQDLLPYMEKWYAQHGKAYDRAVELQPYVDENNVGDYRILADGTWLRYADWNVGETMLRTAPSQKHNVSLEGTSGKTQYRLSFGYDGRSDLMRYNPAKFNRYMANASISTEIFSFLKAGARFNFSDKESTTPGGLRDPYQYMWRWPGFFEGYGYMKDTRINPEGEYYWTRSALGYRMIGGDNKTITTQTRMQGWMEATIAKDLKVYADFTYSLTNMNSDDHRSIGYMINTWQSNWASSLFSPYTQATSYAAQSNSRDNMWATNIYGTYTKTIANDHNLKVMFGWTAEQEEYKYFYAQRYGLVEQSMPNINLTNGDNKNISGSNTRRSTTGFFGRINYDYKGIYLLELNGRYDASSRFPANQMWAFFPSGSVGYRFSEENYFKPLKSWWSNGKVRASYGQVGNEAVGSYRFLSTASQVAAGSVYWLDKGQKITEYNMPSLVSSSLTWERVETADVGIDLGFLNNSLTFSFDWYNRDTKDMLAPAQVLPDVLGTSTPYSNNGMVRTRGYEISLGWNHSFGDADVYVTATLADARTKVEKWKNDSQILYTFNPTTSNYCEGYYYGDILGFETDRYFTEDDLNADGTINWYTKDNPNGLPNQTGMQSGSFSYGPGDVKYKDLNGDGYINNGVDGVYMLNGKVYFPGDAGYDDKWKDNKDAVAVGKGTKYNHGDLKVIGNAMPRYEYGVRLGGAWKGFDIDMFFQGVGKRNFWNTGSFVVPMAQSNLGVFEHQLDCNTYIYDSNDKIVGYNIDQDNWYPVMYAGSQGAGKFSNLGNGSYNFYPQTKYLLNMAYLRFKNLTLGYTIPAEITQKALIQKARVYFSAENLCFLYNGARKYHIDPEISTGLSSNLVNDGYAGFGRTTPMSRTFSFGLQVTF